MDFNTSNVLKNIPINLELLKVEEPDLVKMGKVTDTLIFDKLGNFAEAGLFSTKIFGNVGSAYRSRVFGYIDLKTSILHPLIYTVIISLKSFYKQIAEGTVTAVWNEATQEFEKSNSPEASTGYHFFYSHVDKMKFVRNNSTKRGFLIDLYEKSVQEKTYMMRYLLVIPAGLRDFTVDGNGKSQEDEINAIYRKFLFQSSIIDMAASKKVPEVYDAARIGLQNNVVTLFLYIKSLLEGKNKHILSKWLSRKVFNSTRNVASNFVERVDSIDHPNRLNYNTAFIGIHQFLRCLVPKSLFEIKEKYIRDIFIENSNRAILTNAKTLKKEEVLNTHIQKDYDMWTSADGIEKVIANLINLDIRDLPITVNKGKHYLGLLYRDTKCFKFFQDIDELPEGFSPDNVKPITLVEFLYMSIYRLSGKYPGFITRYPITGWGSIFPCMVKVITTTDSSVLTELNDMWAPSEHVAASFPTRNGDYFNTTSVHSSHNASLDLDFDGDLVSCTLVLADESITEVTNYLNSKEYYINDSGKLNFSCNTDILSAALSFMT